MNAIKNKLAGMRWLFIKPGKFFDDVVRSGSYWDGFVFMVFIALILGYSGVLGDSTRSIDMIITDGALLSLFLFIGTFVITSIWGLFAALIGMKMRPRIAVALTLKEAIPRCLRVTLFSLAPLAILVFHGSVFLGIALLGVLVLSVIGASKALSIKIIPALILQALVCGSIVGGGALAIDSFFKDPAIQARRNHSYPAKKLVGQPAPNILIEPTGGTPLHLGDHKGKNVLIIDFWATWCPPCRYGLPMVSEVAAKYKDKGVVFYAIGDGSINQEKLYLEQRKIDAIPSSTNAEGFEAFMVQAIPETIVIDRQGNVKSVHIGLSQNEKEELTSEIEAALAAN